MLSLKIKVAIVLGTAVLLIVGLLYLKALQADNARLEQAVQVAQAEVAGVKKELAANQAALATREIARAALANDKAALMKQLEEVYKNDKDAETWACTRLPDGVLDCLRP